ncbi:hypothetical protein ACEPAH_4382 [Sanghuangporus vaninii]
MSEMQLGHDLRNATSVTTGGDGTTNKNLNYEALNVNLDTEDAYSQSSGTRVRRCRFLRVGQTANHRAVTQKKALIESLQEAFDVYNRSPLASTQNTSCQSLNEATFAMKYLGSHGDHAEDQKAKHKLLGEWKKDLTLRGVGAAYFELKSDEEKRMLLQGARDAMVQELGGESVWEALHGEERQEKEEEILTRVCESLGPEAFERLPESEQRRLKIWVWVGCGMHKDLNAVKGGDSAMRQKWKELGVSPIPLPNKDNSAVLEALDYGESDCEDCEEFEQEEEPISEALSAAMLYRQRLVHDSTYFGESGASDLNRPQGCVDASGSNGPVMRSCADESSASDLNRPQGCVDASGSNSPVTWSCADESGASDLNRPQGCVDASGSNSPVTRSCADESGASDLNRLGCVDASGSNGPVTWSCADESGASDLNQRVDEIVKRAKNVTKGGGIRTGDLMGNYFRNKDKKKGQQDAFKNHGKHTLGRTVSYPDTSNTRYSSYLEAAAVTIARPQFYTDYLEDVRDRKTNRKFNHLESNIYKALHDKSTLTELAVLALYQEAVSHSYILAVRGKENEPKNALDLGPLHKNVCTHITRLIHEPPIILSPNADPVRATLGGLKEWKCPEAVREIHRRAGEWPYLKEIFIAFLQGALSTWERFSSEFQDDGIIAALTQGERDLAWMPATNDANEGALGALRSEGTRQKNSGMHYSPHQSTKHL